MIICSFKINMYNSVLVKYLTDRIVLLPTDSLSRHFNLSYQIILRHIYI